MSTGTAIIYVRVSTEEQANFGASLESQEEECNRWAFRNGLMISKTFVEPGTSAKDMNRPAMKEMLEYIQRKHKSIDYLLVYQISRLSRDAGDYFYLTKLLKKYHIELRDSSEPLESSSAGNFVRGIKALQSQLENEEKSERVLLNMERKASAGYRMHKAPYGLTNVRDIEGHSTVKPIDGLADKVAFVLREYSTGLYTKRQLVDKCNDIGVLQPNGKPMSIQMVDKMLKQPLYAGLERSTLTNNELVDSIFPGIIARDVFFRNQDILSGKKDSVRGRYKILNPDYPLRGFIYCDECYTKLTASASTGSNGKKYSRYTCRNKLCNKGYVKPDILHAKFERLLSYAKLSPYRTKLIKTIVIRKWTKDSKVLLAQKDNLNTELAKAEQSRIKATEKYLQGKLDEHDFTTMKVKYTDDVEKIENQLADINKRLALKAKDIDYVIDNMSNAPRLWKDAPPEVKVMYQQMIFPEGVSFNLRESKFGTVKYSPLYSLASIKKDPSKSLESLLVIPRGIEPLFPG